MKRRLHEIASIAGRRMCNGAGDLGMFDNDQTRLYTSMLDQQLAQHVAARGTGLSDVMARQLSRSTAG